VGVTFVRGSRMSTRNFLMRSAFYIKNMRKRFGKSRDMDLFEGYFKLAAFLADAAV
jgi:hypothetical protein